MWKLVERRAAAREGGQGAKDELSSSLSLSLTATAMSMSKAAIGGPGRQRNGVALTCRWKRAVEMAPAHCHGCQNGP